MNPSSTKNTLKTRGAVIITRVSTGEQAKNGTSPETQLAACRAKALALNIPVVAEYYDPAISGAFFLLREGMQAAIADIQAGRADTLINPSMSRYSRDVEHQQAIKKAVRAAGGRLVFCDMDFDDSPEGDLNFTIQGGFAEYERKVIRERSMKGKRKRAEDGIQSSRCLSPYGYHIPTKADIIRGEYPFDQLGKYIVIEEQASLIRRLFSCYAAGTHSLYTLAKELNQEGIPTSQGGACWHPVTLQHILRNPVYKGEPAYGKWKHGQDEGRLQKINPATGAPYVSTRTQQAVPEEQWTQLKAPAIVPADVWERAQERSSGNRARLGGNPKKLRMLSGQLRCPACGGSMQYVYQPGDKENHYACGRHKNRKRAGAESGCVPTHYQVRIIEQAVVKTMENACQYPEVIAAEIAAYSNQGSGTDQAPALIREQAGLEKALEDHKQEEKAAVRAQIAGLMANAPADAYNAVFLELAEKRKRLETRRDEIARQTHRRSRVEEPAATIEPDQITTKVIEDLHRVLTSESVTGAQKRDLLTLVVDYVIPRKDGAEVRFLPGAFPQTMNRIVVPFLQFLGINRIDVLVATHPHGDHVGGLAAVGRGPQIGFVLDGTTLPYPSPAYWEFRGQVEQRKIPCARAVRGQTLDMGDGVRLLVLNPPDSAAYGTAAVYGTGSDDATINNYSVSLQIEYGKTRFVLTGDAQNEAESAMLAAHGDLTCDVLKAGHHGSKNATGDDWLTRLQPHLSVISCGRHNLFGHPAPATLARLKAHGVQIFRTDQQGAVTFVSDGKTVTARPFLR